MNGLTVLSFMAAAVEESVNQSVGVLLLAFIGVSVSVAAFFTLVWKIARPHIQQYVEGVVRPLQDKTDAIHRTTTVNGGLNSPPTLLDHIGATTHEVKRLRDDFNAHLAAATRDSESMWSAIEAVANAEPPHHTE